MGSPPPPLETLKCKASGCKVGGGEEGGPGVNRGSEPAGGGRILTTASAPCAQKRNRVTTWEDERSKKFGVISKREEKKKEGSPSELKKEEIRRVQPSIDISDQTALGNTVKEATRRKVFTIKKPKSERRVKGKCHS